MIWLAVRRDLSATRMTLDAGDFVPLRLAIITSEEIALLNDAQLMHQRVALPRFHQQRLARWCWEAYRQDGVLTQLDLTLLCGLSQPTIGRYLRAYEQATGETVPIRGTVLDIGPAVTHKAEVIRRVLRGESPADIARQLHHSHQAVDRYLQDYRKVRILAHKFPPDQIPTLAGLSRRLVDEHLKLLRQYEPDYPLFHPDETAPQPEPVSSVGH